MDKNTSRLPVEDILPELINTLADSRCAVLSAPPGAGKTTRVPVALLNAPWLVGKKILMFEPRRLGARRAAEYMVQKPGERVGRILGPIAHSKAASQGGSTDRMAALEGLDDGEFGASAHRSKALLCEP